MHIGHAKAALLNNYYARKYHGKMILRFDDTNPTNEKSEFTDNILLDLAKLGIVPDQITHTSDYFQNLQDICMKMIQDGAAYIDDTPADVSGLQCPVSPDAAVKGAFVLELDSAPRQYNRIVLEMKEMKPDSFTVGSRFILSGYKTVIIDEIFCDSETGNPCAGRGHIVAELTDVVDDPGVPIKWVPGTVSEQRKYGLCSVSRFNSAEKSLTLWNEMLAGTEKGLDCCVRAKMGMALKNKCMRDPVIYRCVVDTPHPRFGDKFKAYPTYDFACPVVDSLEGVTHAMRTIEYADRNEQYNWFITHLNLRKVNIYEFSKLNFIHTVLSKRKLKWFVENDHVSGWNDPRFPTIQAVMRRGMTVDALLEFVLTQGASRNSNLMEWDKIWAINKAKMDPIVPRLAAVESSAVVLTLSGAPTEPTVVKEAACHPKNAELGTKKIVGLDRIFIDLIDANEIANGEEVTLMGWGNAIIDTVHRDANGAVTHLQGRLNLEGDFKLTKKKLHWLPALNTQVVPVKMEYYSYLITKPKIEETDKIEDFINEKSKWEIRGFGAPEFANLKVGDRIQIERKGYFIVDAIENSTVVLINIPDGKSKLSPVVSSGPHI